MIGLLVAVVAMQLQVAQADVPPIMDAVLTAMVPADGILGGRGGNFRIGDRPLFIDVARSARAFQQLNPDLQPTISGLQREHLPRDYDGATTCAQGATEPRSCRFIDDGVYVAVSNAARVPNRDEYLLHVLVLWNNPKMPWGYEREAFVGKVNGRWQVLRLGVAKVF